MSHDAARHNEQQEQAEPSSLSREPVRYEELKEGDTWGDWKIERFIAAGGMGEVYEVRGLVGGKHGALKRIRPELSARPDLPERFETEIRILAGLEHSCIVGLLHAGRHQGVPYFVMEWLDGITLRDMLNFRSEPFTLMEALGHAILIAEALCAAHRAGILHRDLKPENVFMLKRGGLKVVDFGLGKLTEGNRLSTGNRLGGMCTVYYAAPEQLERKPVDDRTDVYALALIILELLTGLYGFSEKRGELPAREIAQANQLFAQPNSLRGVLPAWLESLAALIEAALSKDKEKRPHSTEMLAGLLAARRTLRAMSRKRGVVVEDEDSADEDSADQPTPAPAAVPAKPAHTTSDIRLIPVLRTETLPPEQPPPDPTAAGNPAPAPVRTIKMARPVEAEFEAARRAKEAAEAAAAAAARAPESTSPGRSATLPPESSAAALPPQSEPVQRTIMTPYPHHPPPQVHHDAAARASLELASRPTVPWKRPEPAREAAASPTPMQRVLPAPAKPARRGSVPVWAGPLLGAALVLGAFGAVKVVRGEASRTRAEQVSTVPTASASATAPTATAEPVVSATAEPVVSATAAPVVSAKPPKRPQVQPSKRKPTVQDILGAEPSYWHENPSPAGGSKPRF